MIVRKRRKICMVKGCHSRASYLISRSSESAGSIYICETA